MSARPTDASANTRAGRMSRIGASRAVLIAAAIAGTLDLLFAFCYYGFHGIPPLRIAQSIASGLFGTAAFQMGAVAGAVGILCHYVILAIAASLYFAAWSRLRFMRSHTLSCGLAYGVAVYLFMHWIVLPLSAAPHFKTTLTNQFAELMSHLFFVGVPIALIARNRLG